MQIEKRYTLVWYKPDSYKYNCGEILERFGSRFEVCHSLTESEAYAVILKHEVEKDPDDTKADYYLFDSSPDRSEQFDWYDRLQVDVPKKREQYRETKEQREATAERRDVKRAKRNTDARDRAEYKRLKAKFDGKQANVTKQTD